MEAVDWEDLKTELARVYDREDAAHRLLDRIGFPPEHRPTFKVASTFWNEVGRELDKGRIDDGPAKLATASAAEYPGNPVFRAGAGENRRKAGDSRQRQQSGTSSVKKRDMQRVGSETLVDSARGTNKTSEANPEVGRSSDPPDRALVGRDHSR